jgi:hypothetical protein
MPQFPTLRTGAIAQYPATRLLSLNNQVLRFLDGSEQRYRYSAGPLRRWIIQLDLLDEGEAASLEQFFLDCQGSFEDFTFPDPWDGKVYPHCSIDTDELEILSMLDMRERVSITVVENREA